MENHATDAILARPQLAYLHHVSLPCRQLEESKRFYIEVLGGELYHDTPGFAEVMLAGMIVGLSEQAEGWTGWEAEYPHYGFNVDAANFALAKPWLDGCGVPTHGWTRDYKTALRYLRDPSGNLIELYCDSGYGDIKNLALGPRQGGVPLPLGELNYRWSGKLADSHFAPPASGELRPFECAGKRYRTGETVLHRSPGRRAHGDQRSGDLYRSARRRRDCRPVDPQRRLHRARRRISALRVLRRR